MLAKGAALHTLNTAYHTLNNYSRSSYRPAGLLQVHQETLR